MKGIAGYLKQHGYSVVLMALALLFLTMLGLTDRQFDLSRTPSNRYRCHAIPVALSQLYHGRIHDYTAYKQLALPFQNFTIPLETLLAKYADPQAPVGEETYYWTADDRGLSDYVSASFRLFGTHVSSLAYLYYLLLLGTLLCFVCGYWREPVVLVLPVLVLLGFLIYAHACPLREQITLGDGSYWREPVALYESRTFETLGVLAWLHLGLLLWRREGFGSLTWTMALPQVLLLIFLYHARSSLGWMYLGLFILTAVRLTGLAWERWRGGRPLRDRVLRPLFVAALLLATLGGLQLYKMATYNRAYFEDRGSRTIWHNALMGYGYHPRLRESLDVGISDPKVMLLVIRRLREANDPRVNENWTPNIIGHSLGGLYQFDWPTYEGAAREIYFDVWRRQPGRAFACYAWYKPRDIIGHSAQIARLLGDELYAGRANLLGVAFAISVILLAACWQIMRRDPEKLARFRTVCGPCAMLLLFSTVPAIAFYAALPTLSAFYIALTVCTGLLLVLLACAVSPRVRHQQEPEQKDTPQSPLDAAVTHDVSLDPNNGAR
jgi:hypothetical protein